MRQEEVYTKQGIWRGPSGAGAAVAACTSDGDVAMMTRCLVAVDVPVSELLYGILHIVYITDGRIYNTRLAVSTVTTGARVRGK